MTERKKSEKIYITYKTRMISEARLREEGHFYNRVITWYSFALISFSLSNLIGFISFPNSDLFFTIFAIALFGLSLHVLGEKHFEKAQAFKDCYLQLKELYESGVNEQTKMSRYADILRVFENQRDIDYDQMVFDATQRQQDLYNSDGEIVLTKKMISSVSKRKFWRNSFRIAILAFPVALALLLSVQPVGVSTSAVEQPKNAEPVNQLPETNG